MTPTDNKGVHTHDFRLTGRCICGELAVAPGVPVAIPVPETDWKEYAADYLSGDPERMKKYLPAWMRDTEVVRVHMVGTPDMETRAELFNEGYDTAHRQGVGGDKSYGWLVGKLAPILDEIRGELADAEIDDLITAIADLVLDDSLERDPDPDPRPDQKRGMYGKYFVQRLHDDEGKHADDRFFVLDPEHDPYALVALKQYMHAAQGEYPKLAADLRAWITDLETQD